MNWIVCDQEVAHLDANGIKYTPIRAPWTSGRDNIHEDIGCATPL